MVPAGDVARMWREGNAGLGLRGLGGGGVVGGDAVEEGEELVQVGGGDEGDAEWLETKEAMEVAAVVLAHLEDGLALAFEGYGGQQVLTADGDTLLHRRGADGCHVGI